MKIGFDIGGTNIKALITDENGDILSTYNHATGKTRDEILDNIDNAIKELVQDAGTTIENIGPVGVGIPGSIDSDRGYIHLSPNIPSICDCFFADILGERINKKVYLLNDATAALLGEWWLGHGKKYKNWLMLTLGTGIGGGAIVNNKLLTGRDGFAAEFGHMSIDFNGIECSCGNRGCIERYASASSIAKLATVEISNYPDSALNNQVITSELLHTYALQNDVFAMHMMDQCALYLAYGINSLLNAYNPEAVIFAGGLSHASDILFPKIKDKIEKIGYKGIKENVEFFTVEHEHKGPALGAIKFVLDQLAEN